MEISNQLLDIDMISNSKKSLLELFIRRTSVITSTPESLVEKIIKDQWAFANKQTQPISNVAEIEFSNIGTLYLSKNKATKRLAKLDEWILELENGDLTIEKNQLRLQKNKEIRKTIKFKMKIQDEY